VSAIPVLLRGQRVRALVVGGGEVAARKVGALLDGGASVRVVAPEIAGSLREIAAARGDRLRLVERAYTTADIGDANLVVAATSSRETNAAVANDADRVGRLASVADAPEEGAWTAMATHRAGDLVIAVSAAGVPGAARRVRDALASRFDGRYADGLARLAALRRDTIARRGRDQWRRAADDLTGASFCEEVEEGAFAARVTHWEREDAWR
jgi:precorrin-2 dehydrogenase/sirohydrochlorin ferrochelatase